MIKVSNDVGSFTIHDWMELWTEMFRALSCGIYIRLNGACRCGCDATDCNYCIHECF
jgi:hypothetical protein